MFKPFDLHHEQQQAKQRSVEDSTGWKRWQPSEIESLTQPEPEASQYEQEREIEENEPAVDIEQEALEKLKQEAYDEAYTKGFEEGKQQGFTQGQEEGRKSLEEQGEQMLRQILDPVKALSNEFNQAVQTLDNATEQYLVELALVVGEHLAGEAMKAQPEQVAELIRKLLHAEPPLTDSPQLYVNPDDYTIVNEVLEQDLKSAGWQLKTDDRLTRGGCYVASSRGELDASWETRWASVVGQIRQRIDS